MKYFPNWLSFYSKIKEKTGETPDRVGVIELASDTTIIVSWKDYSGYPQQTTLEIDESGLI